MSDSLDSTKTNVCSVCGAGLLPAAGGDPLDRLGAGLCPRCLMADAALATAVAGGTGAGHVAPTPAEVTAAFPQFEIIELIGTGGMGTVWRARQPTLNRHVALKLLPASLAERDPAFAERFEREGQLLARLHHPNIVTVHDSGRAGSFFYLLMEFVDGVNLRQAMRASRFTSQQALTIVPKICDALQYAHEEGVLHRDIKPENILLDAKGRVKLVDFGIAKVMAQTEAVRPAGSTAPEIQGTPGAAGEALTQGDTTLGTPNYMAPEQIAKPADVDHRADIYSLGVVFYELLTGELPLGKFAPPSERSAAADPRLDGIVQQALEKERGRRQQSVAEVRTQVETVAGAGPAPQAEGAGARAPWRMPLVVWREGKPSIRWPVVWNQLAFQFGVQSATVLLIWLVSGRVFPLEISLPLVVMNALLIAGLTLTQAWKHPSLAQQPAKSSRLSLAALVLAIALAAITGGLFYVLSRPALPARVAAPQVIVATPVAPAAPLVAAAKPTDRSPRETVAEFLQLIKLPEHRGTELLVTHENDVSWRPEMTEVPDYDHIRPLHQLNSANQAMVLTNVFHDKNGAEQVFYVFLQKENGQWLMKSDETATPRDAALLTNGFAANPAVKYALSPAEFVGEWSALCEFELALDADGTGLELRTGPGGTEAGAKPDALTWDVSGSTLRLHLAKREEALEVTFITDDAFSFPTGPGGSNSASKRGPKAPPAAAALPLHQVAERVLAGAEGAPGKNALDLETGRTESLTRYSLDDAKLGNLGTRLTMAYNWITQDGLDLVGRTEGATPGVQGFDVAFKKVDDAQWDAPKADELRQALAGVRAEAASAEAVLRNDGATPATFAFRTREGSIGLLQILGTGPSPKTVKIRYQLVGGPQAAAAAPATVRERLAVKANGKARQPFAGSPWSATGPFDESAWAANKVPTKSNADWSPLGPGPGAAPGRAMMMAHAGLGDTFPVQDQDGHTLAEVFVAEASDEVLQLEVRSKEGTQNFALRRDQTVTVPMAGKPYMFEYPTVSVNAQTNQDPTTTQAMILIVQHP